MIELVGRAAIITVIAGHPAFPAIVAIDYSTARQALHGATLCGRIRAVRPRAITDCRLRNTLARDLQTMIWTNQRRKTDDGRRMYDAASGRWGDRSSSRSFARSPARPLVRSAWSA